MKKQFTFLLLSFLFFTHCQGMFKKKEVFFIIKNNSSNSITIRVTQNAPIPTYYFTLEPLKTDFKLFNAVTKLEYSSDLKNFYSFILPNDRLYHLKITFTDTLLSLLTCGCIASHNYKAELIEKYE